MMSLPWGLSWPTTISMALAVVLLLLALRQAVMCQRHWSDLRRVRSICSGLFMLLCLVLAAGFGITGYSLQGYRIVPQSAAIAELQAMDLGGGLWQLELQLPGEDARRVQMQGNALRVDARYLAWHGSLGRLPPLYRLSRISLRGAGKANEVGFPSTGRLDPFQLALAHGDWPGMPRATLTSSNAVPLVGGRGYRVFLVRDGYLQIRH